MLKVMKLINIFENNIFETPIPNGNSSVSSILKNRFSIYLNTIKQLRGRDKYTKTIIDQISTIENLCKMLIKSVRKYNDGSPYNAYKAFSDGITPLEPYLYFRIKERVKYPETISLFRARKSDTKYLSKDGIFHIPFEQRGKVGNQRFSIDGFPCLYLGSSIYVCWEELNRPDFENLYISKFRLKTRRPNILDLTFSVDKAKASILNFNKDNDFSEWQLNNTIEKIIIFPLIISSSIINKQNNDIFKEEYIVPQILLEWARNNNQINAIEYSSMSLPDYNLDAGLYRNYVFPAKRYKNKGCCSFLSSIFELTEPIAWNFAKSINGHIKYTSLNSKLDFNIMNRKRAYKHTEFGHMEQIIDAMGFHNMKDI